MAHRFDTGAALPQRTLIRAAVMARLAPLRILASPPRYIASIVNMPRPFYGEGDDDALTWLYENLKGQSPSLAVAIGRKTYSASGTSATEMEAELEVAIYVASTHARGMVEGRLAADNVALADDRRDPGIETALEHIEELLIGRELGVPGVREMRPVEEGPVMTFDNISVWEQRYSLHVEREINPARDAPLITSIQGNHQEDDIPAGFPADELDVDPLVTITNLLPPE